MNANIYFLKISCLTFFATLNACLLPFQHLLPISEKFSPPLSRSIGNKSALAAFFLPSFHHLSLPVCPSISFWKLKKVWRGRRRQIAAATGYYFRILLQFSLLCCCCKRLFNCPRKEEGQTTMTLGHAFIGLCEQQPNIFCQTTFKVAAADFC